MYVLITGANRGLGRCLTQLAVEEGHTVLATVRGGMQRAGELSALMEAYPQLLIVLDADVRDEQTVSAAAEAAMQAVPWLDCIINNAGMFAGREFTVETMDMAVMESIVDVNLLGPFRVMKHFLGMLSRSKTSSIINISSEAGSLTNAYAGDYAYAISKAGLNMFSEQLNRLLGKEGVRVYSVHPGWMKTDMGGEKAPLEPMESAKGIWQMAVGRIVPVGPHVYLDYTGKPMEI